MQHPAKGPGREEEEDAAPSQQSGAAAWKGIALLFLSPKEMPEKQTLLPDATWTPNVPHGSQQPGLRGEGCSSHFHPACPELPQLLQTHLSQEPWALLSSSQASHREDRCWGEWGHPLATPEHEPFSSPTPSSPFPSSSVVWDHHSVPSQELGSGAKGTAF